MSKANRTFELEASLDEAFCRTAEALGMSPDEALRAFAAAFVASRGLPWQVRPSEREAGGPSEGVDEAGETRDARVPKPTLNWKDPRIIRTRMQDGKVMMPAAWRDADDED